MAKTSYIPKGYNALSPALAFKGTAAAIEWYRNIFDAKEKLRMENPDRTIGHAELNIGDSQFFLAEENPEVNKTPRTAGGNSIQLYVYVPDVDAVIKKAVNNKAKLLRAAEDMFYGDRVGQIEDPFGYQWSVSTHVRDVSDAEIKQGMKEAMKKMVEMAHHN